MTSRISSKSPEGGDGEQTPRIEIDTPDEVVDPAQVYDDSVDSLRKTVARGAQSPEPVKDIDPQLQSLVVDPINALPEDKRTVRGRVRSGEEIARAIPDVKAFLAATALRKEGKFLELNEAGQLVMADGSAEAHDRAGDNFPTAKISQTHVWYRSDDGATKFMAGKDYFTVSKVDGKMYGARGKVEVLELSEAGKKIQPEIIMLSGLPTLTQVGTSLIGECVPMIHGGLKRFKTWTDDQSLDPSLARYAGWATDVGSLYSKVCDSKLYLDGYSSFGVLRVNLNLEE